MRLFGRSKSKKLQKRVENFPKAPEIEMNAQSIMQYLEKAVALSKEIDVAVQEETIGKDLGEKWKESIRKKGLHNRTLRTIIMERFR